MKKGSGTKTRISLTLDEKLVEEINSFCVDRFMKVSPFIEHLLKKGMEGFKKSKK